MMLVRPEWTYETSMLQPIGGFEPHQAIMQNVSDFTLGPQGFANNGGLGGLGASGGFFARMRSKFRAWKARRQLSGLGFTPYGPRAWAGGRVVPGAASRAAMLVAMGQQNVPAQFAPINAGVIPARWGWR